MAGCYVCKTWHSSQQEKRPAVWEHARSGHWPFCAWRLGTDQATVASGVVDAHGAGGVAIAGVSGAVDVVGAVLGTVVRTAGVVGGIVAQVVGNAAAAAV